MSVTMHNDTICIRMPAMNHMMAIYYKRVGSEWVKYKREMVLDA